MEKVKSFRDLQVWQRAVELAVRVYQITEKFPKAEQCGLISQMRRAAVSVASNIAEGHRRSNAEFGHYLMIILGSLAEIETQFEITRRVSYLSEDDFSTLNKESDILGRQLNTLRQRLAAYQPPAPRPEGPRPAGPRWGEGAGPTETTNPQ